MGLERLETYQFDVNLRWRLAVSICAALAVHFALWQVLSFQNVSGLKTDLPEYISVEYIEDKAVLPDVIAEPEPEPEPEPESISPLITTPAEPFIPQDTQPNEDNDSTEETRPKPPENNSAELIISQITPPNSAIDERFRLEQNTQPVDPSMAKLRASTDCFGFEAKCAEQRKSLFADYQATDEQRALEQRAPHVGLPAEFYGLSEREIRRRLNVPFAGENGQVIIPFLLTIDGPIWDALHGVNKPCEHKFAGNGKRGPRLIKDCGSYRRADRNAFERFEQQRDGGWFRFKICVIRMMSD